MTETRPPARLPLRFALPATLGFIQFGRSRKRRMETKKFLRLLRQGYGLFAAKLRFKPHDFIPSKDLLTGHRVSAALAPGRISFSNPRGCPFDAMVLKRLPRAEAGSAHAMQ